MASLSSVVMKPRHAHPLGVICLVILLVFLGAAALAAASPSGAAPSTTECASALSQSLLLAVQQRHLVAPDGVWGSYFGWSVAIDGDTAVVGAREDAHDGSVYVFTRSGTTWSQQAKLMAADGVSGDEFGWSVAISGDTIVVGAAQPSDGPGCAYVFTRSGPTWTQQAKLAAANGADSYEFGRSVATSGDTIVVGANRTMVGDSDPGSAYVFTRSGTTWSQQAELLAADGAGNDQFGWSVAVSGDTVVVGAPYRTVGSNAFQGSAYVFTRSGNVWSQQDEVTAFHGTGGKFGSSVALSGDTALVGAWSGAVNSNGLPGFVYVFTRSGTTWSQQATLTASDGEGGDAFGESIAVSGDTAVVGAASRIGRHVRQGSAYVFTRSGATWQQQVKLTAADGATLDDFGCSVALSGSTVVVGAYFDTVGTTDRQGSAYVFALKSVPAPSISRISPTRGKIGITMTIVGKNFGAKRGIAKVLFGTKAAAKYVFWSARKIKVRVPKTGKGRKAVRVVIAACRSNAKYFTRL